jgi:hypothetical protein
MAPFYKTGLFGEETSFLIAFILGISFGFWLERAGFGSSRKLALQFYFRDVTVLKVMFTAIVTAMIGSMFLSLFGMMDLSLVYINPTYLWPQIVGGLILGVGFTIGGYCPGTAVVGCSTGRIDGYIYLLGAMFGMFIFGETYPMLEAFHKSGSMGYVTLESWMGISMGTVGFLVILLALGMFWGGEWLENKFKGVEVTE